MPRALTPVLSEVIHHIALNHNINGLWVFSKIVPAVTEALYPQVLQTTRPLAVSQDPLPPQWGQLKPPAHRS